MALVQRTIKAHYSMFRRAAKGKDRYGKGEDKISIVFSVEHKARIMKLGTFALENMESLLGKTHPDYIKMLTYASNIYKGVTNDRLIDAGKSAWSSNIESKHLIPWGKTFKSASPYMMYYANLN